MLHSGGRCRRDSMHPAWYLMAGCLTGGDQAPFPPHFARQQQLSTRTHACACRAAKNIKKKKTSCCQHAKLFTVLLCVTQDDMTVQDLAAQDRSADVKGWLQHVHAWLFERDLFAGVAADANLMRIHATAEEFEPAAEDCFVPFQVTGCKTSLHTAVGTGRRSKAAG